MKNILSAIILIGVLSFSYFYTKNEKDFNPLKRLEFNQNKIYLIYFGFLSCPDACPTTMSSMKAVFSELEKTNRDKVTFIFIDLDPERDTPVKINKYLEHFQSGFQTIIIPLNELNKFANFFGASFTKVPLKSAMGYTIDHSTDIVVVSPKKIFLPPIKHGTPQKQIVNLLNTYIKENF